MIAAQPAAAEAAGLRPIWLTLQALSSHDGDSQAVASCDAAAGDAAGRGSVLSLHGGRSSGATAATDFGAYDDAAPYVDAAEATAPRELDSWQRRLADCADAVSDTETSEQEAASTRVAGEGMMAAPGLSGRAESWGRTSDTLASDNDGSISSDALEELKHMSAVLRHSVSLSGSSSASGSGCEGSLWDDSDQD